MQKKVSTRLQTFFALFCLFVALTGNAWGQAGRDGTFVVAAASDLQYALPEISASFRSKTGISVKTTFGSSGKLAAQIENGAPFDVLMSADETYPRELVKSGAAEPDSLEFYARGCLAIWVGPAAAGSGLKPDLKAMDSKAVKHVAIANPKHAPYGRAAVAALKSAGIYEKVEPKLILGENISQTAQFVDSGNAEAGLVALSLLKGAEGRGGQWALVPLESYPALDQAAVITKHAAGNPAAKQFLEFLKSDAAQKIFDKYGFKAPSKGIAR